MTRSVRKRPYASWCGGSQKKAKVCGNRILRHRNRNLLAIHGEDAPFFIMDEVMDRYSMPQDGSRHYESWNGYHLSQLHRYISWVVMGLHTKPYNEVQEYRRWFRWVKAK